MSAVRSPAFSSTPLLSGGRSRLPGTRTVPLLVAAAVIFSLAVAAISLAICHAFGFDEASWVVWARETLGPGRIRTTVYGSSWKPLPVILIAPFTLITRGHADIYWWLFVNRFGVLLGTFGASALAYRYAGRAAALLVVVIVVISPWWLGNSLLGKAEPLAAALLLLAVLAHNRRWPAIALPLAIGAAMIRPEAWPFVLVYAFWLVRTHRLNPWYAVLVTAAGLLSWTVPEILHTGPGAALVARSTPGLPDAARNGRIPALLVFRDTISQMHAVPAVLAAVGVFGACYGVLRRSRRPGLPALRIEAGSSQEAVLALSAAAWVVIVAVMAQVGFAGSPRYVIPAAAVLSITAATVVVRLVGGSRLLQLLAAAVAVAVIIHSGLPTVHRERHLIRKQTAILARIQGNVNHADCPGAMWTSASWTALIAEMTGQSLPESFRQGAGPRGTYTGRGPVWTVSCAPAPSRSADVTERGTPTGTIARQSPLAGGS